MMAEWGRALAAAQMWLGINKRSQVLQACLADDLAPAGLPQRPAQRWCSKEGHVKNSAFSPLPFTFLTHFSWGVRGSPSNVRGPSASIVL